MTLPGSIGAGPVVPTRSAVSAVTPLPLTDSILAPDGFLGRWQQVNAETTIPCCVTNVEAAGSMDNLRSVCDESIELRGPRFSDSDVYKTLEACGWSAGTRYQAKTDGFYDEATALLRAAQDPDGYLNSAVQRNHRERFTDLSHGHEMYCAGHLIQAGIAYARSTGDRALMDVGARFADLLCALFGSSDSTALPGHPEIETALVELYRETGDAKYLGLAGTLVERRGHRLLDTKVTPSEYFQDHLPVRDNRHIVGHAVRATYLAAGATDVAVETGDLDLLDSMRTLWTDMVDTKTYPTGGIGARHDGEAFGDGYELPPDRAYAESCAAIASLMWSWRLLLATGEARYADLMERTLFNGIASSVSLSGAEFFYVNPLQTRSGDFRAAGHEIGRVPWFGCACCPPNIARLVASLGHYMATRDDHGIQVHQYAAGALQNGPVELTVRTDYPWHGTVHIDVAETPDSEWALSLRIPAWSTASRLVVAGEELPVRPDERGYAVVRRRWSASDTVTLDLDLRPRIERPHPRVDAARGCGSLERGPIVYCLEETDQPAGVFEDLTLDFGGTATEVAAPAGLPGGTVALHAPGRRDGRPVELTAIPYHQWANRGPGAMRVWTPLS